MKSFKKIVAGVCSLLMISTVATSVAFAELGDSIGSSIGTSDVVTPGTSDDKPGDSGNIGDSDKPGDSDKEVIPTPTGILGDANGDGRVKVNDIQVIRRYLLHLANKETINWTESDINKDGQVKVNDIQYIRQYLLHMISSLDDVANVVPGESD